MNDYPLTLFSYGGGQDSRYLLDRFAKDKAFRKKHISGRLLVVGADTGDEHKHTYASIALTKAFCKLHNIEFYWVTSDMGYHPRTWQSLIEQYKRNSSIGSAAYPQTCTDNLKIKVVDKFVEHWLSREYGYQSRNKRNYHKFVSDHGKIRLIIGYAKGEESRILNGNLYDAPWKQASMDRYYPLLEEGIDRQACIDYNRDEVDHKVWPSNCKRCFFQLEPEILWLYRFEPEAFQEWVELEAAKLAKHAHKEKNYGVYGKTLLTEKLERAIKLYGHWTDEQLNEYKFSHGHCMKSKY